MGHDEDSWGRISSNEPHNQRWPLGRTITAEVQAWTVEIEGRGGDSVHDAIYLRKEDAAIASAIDGKNYEPRSVCVYRLSDGTYIHPPSGAGMSNPPTDEKIKTVIDRLPPVVRLLFERKKKE